jgi:hypothetical protein
MHKQWSPELRLHFAGIIGEIISFENISKANRTCQDRCHFVFLMEKRTAVLQKAYVWALGVSCTPVRPSDEVYKVDRTSCALVVRRQDDQCSIVGRAFVSDNVPGGDYESYEMDLPASRASAFPGLDLLKSHDREYNVRYMRVRLDRLALLELMEDEDAVEAETGRRSTGREHETDYTHGLSKFPSG